MRWRKGRRSGDIIDRRGAKGGLAMGGAVGLPAMLLIGGVYLVMNLLGGGDNLPPIGDVIGGMQGGGSEAEAPLEGPDPDAKMVDFMSFVIEDVQDYWTKSFASSGKEYKRAELILFEGATGSGCGGAREQYGPHYCPPDQRIYLDLDFFRELRNRFDAPGDFAQAYVIAHEVAHHVQTLLGINGDVRQEQQQNPDLQNELSVRMELQADCLSGVWAYSTFKRDILESGDLEEGLQAAAAIGDDRIQEQAGQQVNPETWTHGSSEQRVSWFRRGFDSGDPSRCDTFSGDI